MKKIYFFFLIVFSFIISLTGSAQVNLPYTLHFSSNATSAWSDGIAQDGDGGTQNINGLDIQIFAATSSFSLLPGSTMTWHNNGYFASADGSYNALTPGPDIDVTLDGIPAMVIKSSNTANNFSLTSLKLYDWGGNPTTRIAGYNNGTLIGTITINFDVSGWTTKTITQSDALTPSIFQNVDEVRFYPQGASEFWLSLNDIGLAAASGTLPVQLLSFDATVKNNNSVLLQWKTAQEFNSDHFDIEHSADGLTFTKAGIVQAKGTTNNITDYSFHCNGLSSGKHFYRLKQVDADGKATYSQVVQVTITGDNSLLIYPNPVKNIVGLTMPGEVIQQVKVFNASGRLIQQQQPNADNTSVDLTGHPKGIYFLDIVTTQGIIRRSVVKE